MRHTTSQTMLARGLSLLWFPIAFAAMLGGLALGAYTHPEPHAMAIGVVAPARASDALAGRLDAMFPQGFVTHPYHSAAQAESAIGRQEIVAAVVDSDQSPELMVTSASSNVRATYLERVLPQVLHAEGWPSDIRVADVVAREPGDTTGTALMFWGVPLLVTGFITSILLLQFAAWSVSRKAVAIGLIGAVSSFAVFGIADALDVLPAEPLLLVYGFVLTQAIAWVTTGLAPLVRQFFVPVAATFVFVLGLPSATGTMPADMLPGFARWLAAVMPLAQTVSLGRAAGYFANHGTLRPLSILLGWAVLGAALMIATDLRGRAHERATRAEAARAEAEEEGLRMSTPQASLVGSVRTVGGQAVEGATVAALSPTGAVWNARSLADGTYEVAGLPYGTLHVAVVAPHAEPEFSTVVIHPRRPLVRHQVVLADWNEPVAAASRSEAHDG